jgi:hypothetical protein
MSRVAESDEDKPGVTTVRLNPKQNQLVRVDVIV